MYEIFIYYLSKNVYNYIIIIFYNNNTAFNFNKTTT